jgi:hypothetical protein
MIHDKTPCRIEITLYNKKHFIQLLLFKTTFYTFFCAEKFLENNWSETVLEQPPCREKKRKKILERIAAVCLTPGSITPPILFPPPGSLFRPPAVFLHP